jgi:outer membrane protein assembly factor BamD (BamD/ComL family)
MAMADRLFNRGEYAAARAEYLALRGEKSIDAASLAYRLSSSAHAVGDNAAARAEAGEFLAKFPDHKEADAVRLMRAMCGSESERKAELRLLDRDGVQNGIRAEALVRLADLTGESSLYAKALKLDPKGRLASYSRLKYARSLRESKDEAFRRKAVQELMELVFGSDVTYAKEALYTASTYCYADGRYDECATLLKRYEQKYPSDQRLPSVRKMRALSEMLAGRYAAALTLCTNDSDETLLYVKAISSSKVGEREASVAATRLYLDSFPQGANRRQMDLLLARAEFDSAISKTNGLGAAIASAKRAVSLVDKGSGASDRLRLGWAYEKAGQDDLADETYATVARDFPKTDVAADALYRRAMGQLRREKWAAAELTLAEALASGKLSGERLSLAGYWRGIAAMRAGHEEQGVQFLRSAVAVGLPLDESREARLLIADFDYNSGRREEAVKAYTELVSQGALSRMSAAKTHAVGRLLSGEAAKACAASLIANESAQWRQAGWALSGDLAEAENNFVLAGNAYEKCLAEPCTTEVAADVSIKYAGYLLRDGRPKDAEAVYAQAVKLNANNADQRAAAYLGLAKAAMARDDAEAARGYATIVVTLFETSPSAAQAKEILK